jgi:Tfp pilus assembly protein PilV
LRVAGVLGYSQLQVKSVFQKFLILCCALYLSGAHWMLLQATAWTGMIVMRAQRAPMAEAVQTTFDGKHPCRMCSAINDGQKEQKQREFPLVKMAQEMRLVALEWFELPTAVMSGETQWPDFIAAALRRMEAPPTPPPVA